LGGQSLLPSLDVLGEGVVDGENTFEQLDAVHVVHGGSGVLALEEVTNTKERRAVAVQGRACGGKGHRCKEDGEVENPFL
jgi:hypothetical protein